MSISPWSFRVDRPRSMAEVRRSWRISRCARPSRPTQSMPGSRSRGVDSKNDTTQGAGVVKG